MARINVPKTADEFIELMDSIIEKENALAPNGMLSPGELTAMTALRDTAKSSNKLQKQLHKDAEEATEGRDVALGMTSVDTPGTGMYYVTMVRDLILAKNKQNPHKAGEWGFEVDDSPQGGAPTPPNP